MSTLTAIEAARADARERMKRLGRQLRKADAERERLLAERDELVRETAGLGMAQAEVGAELGLSRERIRQISRHTT